MISSIESSVNLLPLLDFCIIVVLAKKLKNSGRNGCNNNIIRCKVCIIQSISLFLLCFYFPYMSANDGLYSFLFFYTKMTSAAYLCFVYLYLDILGCIKVSFIFNRFLPQSIYIYKNYGSTIFVIVYIGMCRKYFPFLQTFPPKLIS